MGKLAQATSKYTIFARFNANGMVEKPDIIGAVFGQTEGLLGQDMDLRELQKTGRVGRIDVDVKKKNGKAFGMITIPSSLDASETALIGACVETIERVGPCTARITVDKIEDVRVAKRQYVVERARELLQKMFDQGDQELQEISEQIKESVRKAEIRKFKGISAGPNIETSDSIVIVEGRADVVNLLRCGIKNAIAIEGTSVPPIIASLSRNKEVTAFLDGDRGGDLILKELKATCDIDFVARAPEDKEVEEISKKEIYKALREKIPADKALLLSEQNGYTERPRKERQVERRPFKKIKLDPTKSEFFKGMAESLVGTRAACFIDETGDIIGRVPVPEMFSALKHIEAEALIFDGEIDQKLLNFCSQRGVKYVIGMRTTGRLKFPSNVISLTADDLK